MKRILTKPAYMIPELMPGLEWEPENKIILPIALWSTAFKTSYNVFMKRLPNADSLP